MLRLCARLWHARDACGSGYLDLAILPQLRSPAMPPRPHRELDGQMWTMLEENGVEFEDMDDSAVPDRRDPDVLLIAHFVGRDPLSDVNLSYSRVDFNPA